MKEISNPGSDILIIGPEPPWPVTNGWCSRNFQLIRAVSASASCDVICLASAQASGESEILQQLGARSYQTVAIKPPPRVLCALLSLILRKPMGHFLFSSNRLRRTLRTIGSNRRYKTVLLLGDVCTASYVEDLSADRVVLDMCDDLAGNYLRRAGVSGWAKKIYFILQSLAIRRFMGRLSSSFSKILAVSVLDQTGMSGYIKTPVITIPLGVDTIRFHPDAVSAIGDEQSVLFIGAMRSWPNSDAAHWFAETILPAITKEYPGVRFHIAGSGAEELRLSSETVVNHGFSADLRSMYCGSTVFVCPLRVGTGIKGKMLEAMACGCAIVSTSVGVEGLSVSHGEHVLVADDASEFGNAVMTLLADPNYRSRLGAAAREHVQQEFSLTSVRDKLHEALQLR